MSENQSERSEMSASVEACQILRGLSEPATAGESIKGAIWRASRLAGISAVRAKAIWYGEARAIRAEEMDSLRQAAKKRGQRVRDAKAELADLQRIIADLDALATRAADCLRGLDAERERPTGETRTHDRNQDSAVD